MSRRRAVCAREGGAISVGLVLLVLLGAGCQSRRHEEQMKVLLEELTIARGEIKRTRQALTEVESRQKALDARMLEVAERLEGLEGEVKRLQQSAPAGGVFAPSRVTAPSANVRVLGPGHVEVDRVAVWAALEPGTLLRSARILPQMQGGQITGMRLFGMQPTSLLRAIGLQNGDVVERVNNVPVTSTAQVLRAQAHARLVREIVIEYRRLGQTRALKITLVN